MIIVKPISDIQEITVLVRRSALYYDVIIAEEETGETSKFVVQGIYDNGMLTFTLAFPFIDSRFYWMYVNVSGANDFGVRVEADGGTIEAIQCLSVLDTGVNVNKSKIYSTSEDDLQTYSMTEGYYKEIDKPKSKFYVKE